MLLRRGSLPQAGHLQEGCCECLRWAPPVYQWYKKGSKTFHCQDDRQYQFDGAQLLYVFARTNRANLRPLYPAYVSLVLHRRGTSLFDRRHISGQLFKLWTCWKYPKTGHCFYWKYYFTKQRRPKLMHSKTQWNRSRFLLVFHYGPGPHSSGSDWIGIVLLANASGTLDVPHRWWYTLLWICSKSFLDYLDCSSRVYSVQLSGKWLSSPMFCLRAPFFHFPFTKGAKIIFTVCFSCVCFYL